MRKVTFIVAVTVFGVVTAGWNQFHGHNNIKHHIGPLHFGSHHESVYHEHHESHKGPHHFGPPHKHPHYRPPYESPYFGPNSEYPHYETPDESPQFRPPHGSPHFGHPEEHHFGDFRPPHHPPSHHPPSHEPPPHHPPPHRPPPHQPPSNHPPSHHPPPHHPLFHHPPPHHPPCHHSPPHHPPPHDQPPWKRPNWDRPGLEVDDCDSDSSCSSGSSEEGDDNDPGYWNTQTAQPQWTTPTTVQTTTESATKSASNESSSHRTYNPLFILFGTPTTASYSETVQGCVTSCKKTMTAEYNPVCGTNNVTYHNIGLLLCAKGCGVDVEVKRKFPCPREPVSNTYGDTTYATLPTVSSLTSSTATPTASGRNISLAPPAVSELTTMSPRILNCLNTCPFNGAFSPVCGTNLVTYFNHDRFMCAKKCGVDVELRCKFPCATSNCYAVETTTTKATTTISSRHVAETTPPIPSLSQCLSTCLVSTEYNPVCGTNNVTYGNPSKLQCAQMCGFDVRLKHLSTCRTDGDGDTTSSSPTTPATAASTTLAPYTVACMRGCAVTPEYNPVCGTNNMTYTNPGRLECAQACGVDVEIRFNSSCTIANTNDLVAITDPPTTYHVTEQPSQTTNYHGTQQPSQTTNYHVTEQPSQTTASGFTIEQSLLDSIFGRTTTTIETMSTTESDEAFSIDPRFNHL